MPELARELSGPAWVARFPGSSSIDDLSKEFRDKARAFVAALLNAGCTVSISSTLRPPKRAWLMHYSTAIARNAVKPEDVPDNAAINIEWVHRTAGEIDRPKSRSAAVQMMQAYRVDPTSPLPALESRHTQGNAIDMSISWAGTLRIVAADKVPLEIEDEPRTGLNPQLQTVGHGYGVEKAMFEDDPHWSTDGH